MSSNVGHAIQTILNNTPVAIAVNEDTTSVLVSGGDVHIAGLINHHVEPCFRDLQINPNIVGRVIDIKETESIIYLLNDAGTVFSYDYNNKCNPMPREVYLPEVCGGDPAVKIASGSNHLLILTKKHKVFGVGSNEQYQIEPYGRCEYPVATEIIITDTNFVSNTVCSPAIAADTQFYGRYRPSQVVVPQEAPCNKVQCLTGTLTETGSFTINGTYTDMVNVDGENSTTGIRTVDATINGNYTLSIPVSAVGCANSKIFSGVTTTGVFDLTIDNLKGLLDTSDNYPNFTDNIKDILFTPGVSNPVLQTIAQLTNVPITNSCGTVCLDVSSLLSTINGNLATFSIIGGGELKPELFTEGATSSGTIEADTFHFAPSGQHVTPNGFTLGICGGACGCGVEDDCEACIPQPCWKGIYAGFDISVLVDECNRLYVLGSLYELRSNELLARKGCMDQLLNNVQSTISFPADQLNCRKPVNNCNEPCVKRDCNPFKTDLSKFGIQVSFIPNVSTGLVTSGSSNDITFSEPQYNGNVCDFLRKLKECNDNPICSNTCDSCDTTVYIALSENCSCSSGTPSNYAFRFLNRKSVCKGIATGMDIVTINVPCLTETVVEFDLNDYCINGSDYALCKTIIIQECNVTVDACNIIDVYIDLDNAPGAVAFVIDDASAPTSVFFNPTLNCGLPTDCTTCPVPSVNKRFILNFGDVMDPSELTSLTTLLGIFPAKDCPRFYNPRRLQLFSTYIKGGDRVTLDTASCTSSPNLMVTADVPTVFDLHKRVVDVAVGQNSLHVLTGSLTCANEVYALGKNCHGELGIQSHVNALCWKKVNRCFMDCQVVDIEASETATFFITQSGSVYASGLWGCEVHSEIPVRFCQINPCWKVKRLAVTQDNLVALTYDNCLFGVGSNKLGQLGITGKPWCAQKINYFGELSSNVLNRLKCKPRPKKAGERREEQYERHEHREERCEKREECCEKRECCEPCKKPNFVKEPYSFAQNCEGCCVKPLRKSYNPNARLVKQY